MNDKAKCCSNCEQYKQDALKWRKHQESIRDYMEEWSKFQDEQEKFENGK